ncbi:protein TolQ [Desulfovibrio sp. OttesenSCG-928-I05]|nr:protein TolQ [Desulfovibrio sp. OttesenSCG-928-I05]
MENFNLIDMLKDATLVAQLVLLLLVILSVISWSIMFYKFFSLRSAGKKAVEGIRRFTVARDLREAVQLLSADASSPLFHVAQQGVAEYNRLKESGNSPDVVVDNVRRALRQGVSEAMTPLGSSLAFLATTANTAPFIGLFGTVWGIMFSFHRISQMQTASIATVAPGISEALVATAVGLFVAIPATVGYNTFLNMTARIEGELVNFAGVFLNRVQREINGVKQAGGKTNPVNALEA